SKKLIIMVTIATLAFGTVGCSNNEKAKGQKTNTEAQASNFETVKYVYSDGAKDYDVTVNSPRQKAVTLSQFMTEMLLALGLEDRMVGTALLDNPILPEFEEAYNKIPELKISEGHAVSKEGFLATGADFVSGWDSS
ncbi:iron ABC transporter substrate-binding protein, partial [Clostridium perfringens]|nr:iron ABC transporter substrate-binding protein [Clostridium perfringens]